MKNDFLFREQPFTVDGIDIACCIEDIKRQLEPTTAWFATTTGGTIRLSYERLANRWVPGSQPLAQDVYLEKAEDVAQYVRKECVDLCYADQSKERVSRLESVSSLAIFPGFTPHVDGNENEDLVLDSYVAGRMSVGDAWPIQTLSCFAYPLRAWSTTDATPKYVFKNIPETYLGAIAWYTTVNPEAWGARHNKAMEEAWRYQLKNPKNVPAWASNGGPRNLLLIDRLRPDDRMLALSACGLSEKDVSEARDVADICETKLTNEHTHLMLTQLLARSNLIVPEPQATCDLSHITF